MTINKHRLADWSTAPEWATHHAVDATWVGYWFGFIIKENTFQNRNHPSKIFDLAGINWRETLESRPDPEVEELKQMIANLVDANTLLQRDIDVLVETNNLLRSNKE